MVTFPGQTRPDAGDRLTRIEGEKVNEGGRAIGHRPCWAL